MQQHQNPQAPPAAPPAAARAHDDALHGDLAATLGALLDHYIGHLSTCSGGQWSAEDDEVVRGAAAVLRRAGVTPNFSPDVRARLRRP